MKKKKKILSTYDRITADPRRKANIEKEYQKLVKAEEILAAQEKDSFQECPHSHMPNEDTLKSMENVEKGKNLVESKNLKAFFKKLKLRPTKRRP